MSYTQLATGSTLLSKSGRFEAGVYYPNDPGMRRKDSYEAVWEAVHGRPVEYPTPRYSEPIEINPDGFEWVTACDGVQTKHLGTFDERHTSIDMYELEIGVTSQLPESAHLRVCFVTDGSLSLANQGSVGTHSGFECSPGEELHVRNEGVGRAEFFAVSLPRFT
jgi:hypothetical protein